MTALNFIQKELAALQWGGFHFYVPPGVSLSDIFIDGQEVMQQLNISSRTLQHYRTTGVLSYTDRFGKIWYFKQEIARMLIEGKKNNKKK